MAKAKPKTDAIPESDSTADLQSAEIIPLPIIAQPLDLRAAELFPSPLNPRRTPAPPEADAELERDIVANGLLQPILARTAGEGAPAPYEIILGARRHKAISAAIAHGSLPPDWLIPCRVRPASDEELIVLAGTENLQREDMAPLDEAMLFESLKPFIKARDPKATVAREIAARFHVSERKVYNRLKLLRLAPKAQDALRKGELPLQYAEALAVGATDAQSEALPDLLRNIEHGWAPDPDEIRDDMKGSRAHVDAAAFDLALYTGELIEIDGESYFADMKQFRKLQAKALEVEIEALKLKWPWARGLKKGERVDQFREAKKSDDEAGALAFLDETDRLQVRAPVLDPATVAKRQKAGERTGRTVSEYAPTREANRAPAEKRCLTDSQSIFVKAAKTRAMRHAVANSPDVALAIAVTALLVDCGYGEVWIRDDTYHGQENAVDPDDGFTALRAERLNPIATLAKSLATSSKHYAEVLQAMLKLDRRQQVEIFSMLVAERIGSRWSHDHRVGDSPLAIAIAEAASAEKYLPDLWKPTEEHFKAHGREALEALAHRAWPGVAFYDVFPGGSTGKKGELVKALVDAPAGTWTPDKFVECRFVSDSEMKKAFAEASPAAPKKSKPAKAKKAKTAKPAKAKPAKPKKKAA